MVETWKDVVGYVGKYKVSNLGNVYSFLSNKQLKPHLVHNGYKQVILYNGGQSKPKHCSIHRLVAEAFLPNPLGYPCINHKDENPSNNHADNLEWCSYSDNINYGTRNMKVSQRGDAIMQFAKDSIHVATYINASFAAKMLKTDYSDIYKCLRGEIPYAHGYKWVYASKFQGSPQ